MPLLGVCYGAQYLAKSNGGNVEASAIREYGRANLSYINDGHHLMKGVPSGSQVWMSHGDTITQLPEKYELLASTNEVKIAAYRVSEKDVYGLQFHPEVYHSKDGHTIISNFLIEIAKCGQDWTPDSFVESTVSKLREKLGYDKVVLGLSGGVDSSVAAVLLDKAIGSNLYCIFVDNGLLRKNEFEDVLNQYKGMGLNVKGVDAKDSFYEVLKGINEPEKKRKAIGSKFIDVFDAEAGLIQDVKWLAQGTIYPDVIESQSFHGGPTSVIKSHHNVGGLPKRMKLKLVEPLRELFKDEVRKLGLEMRLPKKFINRHPFPGPGLGIRILGEVTADRVKILQEADNIYIEEIKEAGLYDKIWQAFAVLMPVKTVGVMGDHRSYEQVCGLRAVTSVDGMTADFYPFKGEFLSKVSTRIINEVKGINRVVYDTTSKPPGTIEWE